MTVSADAGSGASPPFDAGNGERGLAPGLIGRDDPVAAKGDPPGLSVRTALRHIDPGARRIDPYSEAGELAVPRYPCLRRKGRRRCARRSFGLAVWPLLAPFRWRLRHRPLRLHTVSAAADMKSGCIEAHERQERKPEIYSRNKKLSIVYSKLGHTGADLTFRVAEWRNMILCGRRRYRSRLSMRVPSRPHAAASM